MKSRFFKLVLSAVFLLGSLAAEESIAREKREREIADQNLMRLYGAPGDVIRARNAKISSIVSLI